MEYQERIETLVTEWMGQKVVLPDHLNSKIQGRDTVCDDLWDRPYRILIPIDSTGCTECKLKLYEWKRWLNSVDLIMPNRLMPLMVVYQSDYLQMERFSKRDRFDYPIFYDRQNKLITDNNLSSDIRFNVFLLDRNNRVVAIGNPILYPSISKLMIQLIQDKRSDKKTDRFATAKFVPAVMNLGIIQYSSTAIQTTVIRNTGNYPLVINNVESSCGCIKVDYPKQPIAPGKESKIRITFKPTHLGKFVKTIRLNANTEKSILTIQVQGEITEDQS